MKELTENFTITTNLRDCFDELKMSSILDLTQEIATHHADILHVGFNDFIKDNLIWVIVRNRFEIIKDISNLSNVTIKTYPLKNNLMEYPRDYEIYNGKNELIIKGRSIWMIYSLNKKNVATPHLEIYEEGRKGVFENRLKRLHPSKDIKIKSFQIEYTSQCYLNDLISLYKYKIDNKYYVYAYKDDTLKFYFEVECNM